MCSVRKYIDNTRTELSVSGALRSECMPNALEEKSSLPFCGEILKSRNDNTRRRSEQK